MVSGKLPRSFATRLKRGLKRWLVVLLVALVSCGPAGPSATADQPASTPVVRLPVFSHIFIIVMENQEDVNVTGDPSAPYLNSLIAQYGLATNFHAIRHPSLPNYLALTGGDTFGITTDCTDCTVTADNIVNQLEAAGRSWKAYMESMPSPCFFGKAPPYAQRHNPFIYYTNVRTDSARCQKIVPLTQLTDDLNVNALPDFVWITPNSCNDMHNCSVGEGDKWLQTWVLQILASPAWRDKGVLFITFDEGKTDEGCCTYASGGEIDTLVVSPLLVQPGFKSEVPYDHYSLLRTVEAAWGLPLLGKASCDCSPPMADFFATP